MKHPKIQSFTLAELVVVMVITAIVIGFAFSILRLVQGQMKAIQTNYDKTVKLAIFEQRLLQDMNTKPNAVFEKTGNTLIIMSETDTIRYKFESENVIRGTETIKIQLFLKKLFYKGKEVEQGNIDAVQIMADSEYPGYLFFVSKANDTALLMNQDGI